MWHTQVKLPIKGAHLGHFIKPSSKPPSEFLQPNDKGDKVAMPVDLVLNPKYEEWVVKDQTVLSYLFGSLTKIFAQVTSTMTTAEL